MRRHPPHLWVPLFATATLGLYACGGSEDGLSDGGTDAPDAGRVDAGAPPLEPVVVDIEASRPPPTLSGFRFFRRRAGRFEYNDRVVPYGLTTPLFSDYGLKERAVYVPPDTAIPYRRTGTLAFPVGSAIIKTFSFAPDLRNPAEDRTPVETRVLIRHADGWRPYPYLWRTDGSDADYFVRGDVRAISFIDPFGRARTAQYLVPQRNQCFECHELKDEAGERFTTIIGPQARYLNRNGTYPDGEENQLVRLERLGLLHGLPALSEIPRAFDTLSVTSTIGMDSAAVEQAARDYMDINCAHCHRPNATQGITSRLFLNYENEDPFHLGICKEPGSAGSAANGRRYDIVPGNAEASILVYRTETEDVGDMMPLLGRSLRDDIGSAIVRGWVDDLSPDTCE